MAELHSQRHLFDLPEDVTYLNCSYFPPMPIPVREAGRRALEGMGSPWRVKPDDFFEPGEALRAKVASLIGGDADGVAFIPAVSYGVGVAARNVPIGHGRKVVLIEEEFPSDVYPWRAAVAERGGEIVVVPRPSSGSWTQPILDAIDDTTAVVVAPHCHWADGRAVDLVAVGEAVRSVGAYLVVDASQSLGAVPIDVSEIQPDALVTVGYKWQMGPYSFGYLWLSERLRAGVPIEQIWTGRKGSEDFNRLVDYTDEYREGARRFDVGEWSNFVLLPMASAALDLLLEWRPERVSAALAPLTALVEERTRELGLEPVPAADRHSHMLGVRFPQGEPDGLRARLADDRISVSLRANAVRVAPHLYNDEEDIERLIEALAAVL